MMLALIFLAALEPAPLSGDQEAIMDEIERAVVLPKGANPFDAYGRNYAFRGPSLVMGIYLLPHPALKLSKPGSCVKATPPDFYYRPCTAEEIGEALARNARVIAAQTPAGNRRWHTNASSLPGTSDGGCMQVNIEYDLAAHRILHVVCNGGP